MPWMLFLFACVCRIELKVYSHPGGSGVFLLSTWLPQSYDIYSFSNFLWWRHQMETFSALLALCAGNSPVNGEFPAQWRGTLMFYLICTWINGWVNNSKAGDLRCHRAHYGVTVMPKLSNLLVMKIGQLSAIIYATHFSWQISYLCMCKKKWQLHEDEAWARGSCNLSRGL